MTTIFYLAFAMTINKFQGQTMSVCDLEMENPYLSYRHLYVPYSCVRIPLNLFVLAKDKLTKNTVHRLVLG